MARAPSLLTAEVRESLTWPSSFETAYSPPHGSRRLRAHSQEALRMARRIAAILSGLLLLVLAGWLASWTVHTVDGPWGRPGSIGTLTVTKCQTNHGGEGDGPTMTCTGTFTADRGGPSVHSVHHDEGRVAAWAPGETARVTLPAGSHSAYQPGSGDWLVRLGVFLALLGLSVVAFGLTTKPPRPGWADRTLRRGGIVFLFS